MNIATFNVENMFRRAVVLNQEGWSAGKPVLEAYAALTDLKDVSQLQGWAWGEREGTFGSGKKEKIDYILLSPRRCRKR